MGWKDYQIFSWSTGSSDHQYFNFQNKKKYLYRITLQYILRKSLIKFK